jgi:two-component system response regulator FixJ
MDVIGSGCSLMIDIVDDDDAVRESLALLLEVSGYDVKAYATAQSYLRDPHASDCLVVDQHMPGISGIELLEQLRASGDKTPAVIVSSGVDADVTQRARVLSIPVLAKPLPDTVLLDYLEKVDR